MMSCKVDKVDKGGGGCGERIVRWERLMPKVSLRVLLVESDESTRQVIAALLRKCCYKATAVSDGLKAWEVLKERPNSIDLILTEMDLPAISGFALLTLIMEHECCKNIPVIMMSKHDLVNMVYKCMVRGAADFLVKPVRKNELQNLWHHVWRRQVSARGGKGMPDESITQQKIEGLLDDDLVIVESNGECTPENGNDAQSSCSVPVLEAEATIDNVQDKLTLKCNEVVASGILNEHNFVVNIPEDGDSRQKKSQKDCNTLLETSDKNDALITNLRPVLDFMATFQNHSTKSSMKSSVINCTSGNDLCPLLELSLRRSSDPMDHHHLIANERRNAVHQSNASAFLRYKASKPVNHTHASDQPRECEGSSSKHISSPIQTSNLHIPISHIDCRASSICQERSDSRQVELPFYVHQQRMPPITNQLNSARLDHTCTSHGSSLYQSYQNHTGVSLAPSPDSGSQRKLLSRAMQVPDPQQNNGCNQIKQKRGVNSDEEPNCSLQREAALIKFLKKRKERCFEKKIRYESRKQLAEKRPRVKGQFVRQVPAEPSTVTTAGL